MAKLKAQKQSIFSLPPLQSEGWLFIQNVWIQAALIVLIGVGFYANTYSNEYALDDDIIIKQNTFVQKGFDGIGEILTEDAYKSFYRSMGVEQQLEGGRYRPLSIMSFAIEQGLFGECYGERYEEVRDSVLTLQKMNITSAELLQSRNKLVAEKMQLEKDIAQTTMGLAPLRHIFQIIWYALSLVVLLIFLRECIFRTNTDLAFLSVLLFAIHPIHTEVVANVKSRDEVFSLLFIALTFIQYFRYEATGKLKNLLWGSLYFLLALLSKEYAIALFPLLPLGLYLFRRAKSNVHITTMSSLAIVGAFYLAIRLGSVGTGVKVDKSTQDPLNDPYMHAKTFEKRFASKIDRLDDYLVLLVYPNPLVADYSYQHFPYSRFTSMSVWVSFLLYAGLTALFFWLLRKKHELAFALGVYLLFFALICNIFMDIGATMGERLIFHSSLGFSMILAWLIVKGAERYTASNAKYVVTGLTLLLMIPAFLLTWSRNTEWKNDYTLFTADVKKHPNSALCNGNAGAHLMNKALAEINKNEEANKIIADSAQSAQQKDSAKARIKTNEEQMKIWANVAKPYLEKAVELHPRYVNSWLNLGLCRYYLGDYENAAIAWGNAQYNFRNNPILLNYVTYFSTRAEREAALKNYPAASYWYRLAATSNPGDAKLLSDYGGSSFMALKFDEARSAFDKALEADDQATNTYGERSRIDRESVTSGKIVANVNDSLQKRWMADSSNIQTNYDYAKVLVGTEEFYPKARYLVDKALFMNPSDPLVRQLSDSLARVQQRVELRQKAAGKK
jgi:tetratricopeptide (TPR) repeat protein